MVALFGLHGSRVKVARAIGVDPSVLRAYLFAKKRAALRATCEAVQPKRPASSYRPKGSYTTNYPRDADLVSLMRALGTFRAVADVLGVRRESLRDYLARRPDLDAGMRAQHPTQRVRDGASKGKPQSTCRAGGARSAWATPGPRRSRVRLFASESASAVEYASVLSADPCSYCGAACQEIDHIDPVAGGGIEGYENLTASCRTCNRQKSSRPLLFFMVRRWQWA